MQQFLTAMDVLAAAQYHSRKLQQCDCKIIAYVKFLRSNLLPVAWNFCADLHVEVNLDEIQASALLPSAAVVCADSGVTAHCSLFSFISVFH